MLHRFFAVSRWKCPKRGGCANRVAPPFWRHAVCMAASLITACDTTNSKPWFSAASPKIPDNSALRVESDDTAFNATAPSIRIEAGIHECRTIDLRFVATDPIEQLDLNIAPWNGPQPTLAGTSVTLFRGHPVTIDQYPVWQVQMVPTHERRSVVHDVLVPIDAPYGGLPTAVRSDQSVHITVDVCVPENTATGDHATDVIITSGDTELIRIPVALTVRPYALPAISAGLFSAEIDYHRWLAANCPDARSQSPAPVPTIAWADKRIRDRMTAMTAAAVGMLADHNVTVTLDGLIPDIKTDARGQALPVWPPHDHVLAQIDAAAGPAARFKLPCSLTTPFDATVPDQRDRMATYLARCVEHFAENGWLDRSHLRVDVPAGDARSPVVLQRMLQKLAASDGRIRLVTNLSHAAARAFPWTRTHPAATFSDADAFSMPARWCGRIDPSSSPIEWSVIDRPPYSGTADLAATQTDVLALAWQAFAQGVTSVVVPKPLSWPRDGAAQSPQQVIDRYHAPLLYPGHTFGVDGPIPSRRLKTLRRAAQDHAMLTLLHTRGYDAFADQLTQSAMPYAYDNAQRYAAHDPLPISWTAGQDDWTARRRLIADVLAGDVDLARPETLDDGDFRRRLERALQNTKMLDIQVEGVRLLPNRGDQPFRVDVWLRIDNHTDAAIAGSAWFGELPNGWQAAEPQVYVASIEPGQARRVLLTATGVTSTAFASAANRIPINVQVGLEPRRTIKADVSVIHARPPAAPMTIDGRLSDWPAADINIADDFASITGQPDKATPSPQVFVLHDTERVYVAARCPRPTVGDSGGNTLLCEDGVPVGPSRFEVLIDASNAGTHVADDLLHIAIGPGGGVFERGVDLHADRQRRVWPADVRYATTTTADTWIIELSIPKSAVSTTHDTDRTWGINFTFYDGTNQTFQTWSGARFNAYDPMSLGNVVFDQTGR